MIKIGLIGIGYWGTNYVRILGELSLVDDIDIYLCDNDPGRLGKIKTLNSKIADNKLFIDYKKMVPILDCVIVATPANTHYQIISDIITLNPKISILCEKPLFTTTEDFSKILLLSDRYKYDIHKKLMIGHTYIFHKAIEFIKKYIYNNELGNIYYISAQRTGKSPIRKDVSALYDLGYHDIYTILYLLSIDDIDNVDIKCMIYSGKTIISLGSIDKHDKDLFKNHNIGLLSFVLDNTKNKKCSATSDIFISIIVDQIEQLKIRKITIVGSKRMLIFDDQSISDKIKIYYSHTPEITDESDTIEYLDHISHIREGDIIIPDIKITEPLKEEISHFVHCVKHGETPRVTILDSFNVIKVLENINKEVI